MIENDAVLIVESIEFVGGAIMRHRYVSEVLEPHWVVCVSAATRARFLYLVPLGFRTTWAVTVETVDGNTSPPTNRIEVEYRPRIWAIPSALVATPFWIWRHSEEETSRFADSVAVAAQHRQS